MPGRAADERLVDEHALERAPGEAPDRGRPGARRARRSARRSTTCCTNSSYSGRSRSRTRRGGARAARPRRGRRSRCPPARAPCRARGRTPAGRSWCAVSYSVRVGEARAQEVVDHEVDFRDLHEPGADRADRQHAHRDAHRQRALGDRVVRAGEADVGVLDFAVGRVGRRARRGAGGPLRARAPRAPARRGRRGRSSGTCRSPSGTRRCSRPRTAPSASRRARPVTSRMSSLEKKPENGGMPDSARPPMMKQP